MSIVITGASGHPGRLVADAVLDQTDPSEVVLVTRDPARLGDLGRRGADVRAGDFADPGSLARAFAGATRVLVIMLRNSIYTEVLLAGAGAALASGRYVSNEGDGRVSYVARAGGAAGAAAVLTTDGHEGK